VGSCVYRKNHCDLQPWALAVCTLPAVPMSTQPNIYIYIYIYIYMRGTVIEYQLFGLSMAMVGVDDSCLQADSQTKSRDLV